MVARDEHTIEGEGDADVETDADNATTTNSATGSDVAESERSQVQQARNCNRRYGKSSSSSSSSSYSCNATERREAVGSGVSEDAKTALALLEASAGAIAEAVGGEQDQTYNRLRYFDKAMFAYYI